MGKHIQLKNPVAIKTLHRHPIANDEILQRFQREAESASRLKHPAIAGVFDVGSLPDGRPFMVMEYLAGVSLADLLESEGALSIDRAVPLFIECCDGLRYAHRKGLLHRDIKPDNIFVVRDLDGTEHAKLLDFGLAKMVFGDDENQAKSLTESGITLGTPGYMSPEQCQAKPLDGRSDLYSLAYSLYEAIAGKRPLPGFTHYEAMEAHLKQRVPPINQPGAEPVIPPALESAILRALEKSPNDRFSTAGEFREALISTVSGMQVTPVARTPVQKSPVPTPSNSGAKNSANKGKPVSAAANTRSSRNVLVAVLAGLLIASLGAFAIVLYQNSTKATSSARQTELNTEPGAPSVDSLTSTTPVTEPAPPTLKTAQTKLRASRLWNRN